MPASVLDLQGVLSSEKTRSGMQSSYSLQTSAGTTVASGVTAQMIRQIIIEQSKRAGVGHIGSGLCVADILAALYGGVMHIASPADPDRDRFVLSKGHAALALYAGLHLRGWISAEELNSFCGNGTFLGVHPEHGLKGVDFSTGSLGQGLSFATGAALAARLQHSCRRVFVLLSDAELNEGSVWEAIMFAGHHRLSNLVAVIDMNGQQAFGFTKDVINLPRIKETWSAFGWNVSSVDGHNVQEIADTIKGLDTAAGAPHVLFANTTFGKGVSFMEGQIKWHYSPLSDSEYRTAMMEVGKTK